MAADERLSDALNFLAEEARRLVADDVRIYGTGAVRFKGDGTFERVSPNELFLTEQRGGISEERAREIYEHTAEAAAILRTLGCAPDSMDLSETDAKVSVGFLRRLLAQPAQGTSVEEMREAAAKIVIGWRECDWPEGFDRITAELMAEDRAERIRALPLPPSPVKGENITRQGGDEE